MHKGLTGWFSCAVKKSTELFQDVFGDIFIVITDPILEDPQDDDTEGAFIVSSIIWSFWSIAEVPVGARFL
jgi:hypothetical protein